MLDPRISYEGMKVDYTDDLMLSDHLEDSKSNLINYFNANYANAIPTPLSSPLQSVLSAPMAAGSPQKSFTAQYHRKENASINELKEYFKLPAKDFNAYDLIHWWISRHAQFPNHFCMARDILCIPSEFAGFCMCHSTCTHMTWALTLP